jgi:hypothetical protein
MAHTAILTEGINAAGVIVTKSFAYTGEGLEAVNVDVPDSTTDKQVLVNIDVSALQVLYINSTQDILIEWNDNAGSQGSINLKANKPCIWWADAYHSNPLGAVDVTSLYLTNASGAAATFNFLALEDVTP